MMKLEVLNNNFIEIEDLIKVLNVNCNLNEYIYENGILKGEFEFEGEYVNDSSSFDKPFNFFKKIPFEIMFVEEIDEIEEVKIEKIEYFEVERRGIESEINLVIKSKEERGHTAEELLEVENQIVEEYDIIKEEAENEITHILDNTFNDEKPVESNDQVFPTTSKRSRIKII